MFDFKPAIADCKPETLDTFTPEGRNAVTVTVADCIAVPPEPVQVSEYVAFAVRGPVLWDPEVAFVPDQAPDAVHELALVEPQESVEKAPETTEVGLDEMETVGAAGVAVTETVADWVAVSPEPVHVSE